MSPIRAKRPHRKTEVIHVQASPMSPIRAKRPNRRVMSSTVRQDQ